MMMEAAAVSLVKGHKGKRKKKKQIDGMVEKEHPSPSILTERNNTQTGQST